MQVATTPEQLTESLGNRPVFTCGFIPTMGALHAGHLALIRRAVAASPAECVPIVVSIFVNPTQFGPGEDFEKYPRMLEQDLQAASHAGATIAFVPEVKAMYPDGDDITTPNFPTLPDVAMKPGLEDAARPGHFAGVCQIVARLFDLVKPGYAVFGEKDFQQLLVIEAMVNQESKRWPHLKIVRHPTVRDPDGLALSSRNRYLTAEQRQRALAIPQALHAARSASRPHDAEAAMQKVLETQDLKIDYAIVRDARTLLSIASFETPARALIAVHVDDVRLIDNADIPLNMGSST